MEARFALWKQTAFGPGTSRFSWQLAVTEARNRQATEVHNRLVPDPAEILLRLDAAKGAIESRRRELLRGTGSQKNNCLFFERSKFRTSGDEALPRRYPLQLSTFCVSGVVGTAGAKPWFVCEPHSKS